MILGIVCQWTAKEKKQKTKTQEREVRTSTNRRQAFVRRRLSVFYKAQRCLRQQSSQSLLTLLSFLWVTCLKGRNTCGTAACTNQLSITWHVHPSIHPSAAFSPCALLLLLHHFISPHQYFEGCTHLLFNFQQNSLHPYFPLQYSSLLLFIIKKKKSTPPLV